MNPVPSSCSRILSTSLPFSAWPSTVPDIALKFPDAVKCFQSRQAPSQKTLPDLSSPAAHIFLLLIISRCHLFNPTFLLGFTFVGYHLVPVLSTHNPEYHNTKSKVRYLMHLSTRKKIFLKGAFVLTFVGLATRVIGFFFRIFLSRSFGTEGIGIYHLIFPVYALCISLSAAGIETALSRLTARYTSLGKPELAKAAFRPLSSICLAGPCCVPCSFSSSPHRSPSLLWPTHAAFLF